MKSTGLDAVRADLFLWPNGRPKGCGIVGFSTLEGAKEAVLALNDTKLKGRRIYVREDQEVGGPNSRSKQIPRVSPHSESALPRKQLGDDGRSHALPVATEAVSINAVNSRSVRCCGKTNKGKQCKDTAKARSLYCNKHSETTKDPTTGGKKTLQCRCLIESGTQCPDTATTGSLYCGKNSLPPKIPSADREIIFRCRTVTHRGARCLDTAKAGSEYCRKHTEKLKAPPTSSKLAQCSQRKMDGERCKDTARGGTLYCRNHTALVTAQSIKTDNVQMRSTTKKPERQQCETGEELIKVALVFAIMVLCFHDYYYY
jgi:hypothetical protein